MDTTRKQKKACLYIIAAAVLWGIIGLFYKRLSAFGLTPIQIVAVRLGVAAFVLFLYLGIFSFGKLKIRFRDIPWFVGMGMGSLVLFNWCYFNAMEQLSLSAAAVLLYTSPVFVLIMSVLLFGERITVRKVWAIVFALAGSALVSGLIGSRIHMSVLGLIYGLGSGFGYALYSILGTILLRKYEPETVSAYSFLFAAVGAVLLSDFQMSQLSLLLDVSIGASAIGIGVICSMLPFTIYTIGLKQVPASRAAVFATLEPAVATLTGLIFFHESISLVKLIGICFIFLGIFLLRRD